MPFLCNTQPPQSKPIISSLPMEILTEIWKCSSHSPSLMGCVVQVSKSWHAAIHIPALWQTIRITESTDLGLLRTWIRRAGQSGLFIHINFRHAQTDVWLSQPASTEYAARFVAIMDILKPTSENWVHLQIYGPHYLHALLKSDLASSLPVPRLEHLSLCLDQPRDPAESAQPSEDFIFHQNLPLTTAEIVAYPMFWGHFPFQQLTHLTLGRFTDHSLLNWNVFTEAIAMSPTLVSLGFVGPIPAILDISSTLLLNLPSVKHISLGLIPCNQLPLLLRFLHTPQLESLALNLSSGGPAWSPHLHTLAFELFWVEDGGPLSVPPFFLRYLNLAALRLNLDGLPASCWHALVSNAANPQVLPRLEEIELVDCPLHSVQELLLLRMGAGKPISRNIFMISGAHYCQGRKHGL
ncbi:hypothetical protein B0H14DRAFT_3642580 [Mycena olivaceomarginata]|nr:hypothetical protein B0H14DRAFT_3642580 [Mycena olivaceomarginata]